jgi:hypothetical protein
VTIATTVQRGRFPPGVAGPPLAPVLPSARTLVAQLRRDGDRLDAQLARLLKFEFITDAGDVLSSSVEPGVVDSLSGYFNERCRAFIVTQTARHMGTGKTQIHYRLQELSQVPTAEG